jgi:hypothetical protein
VITGSNGDSMAGSHERGGQARGVDPAEAALAALVVEQGRQQGRLIEIGPEHIGDVQLGVGQLPEQEVADPLLTAGADQQVGIGLAGGVELGG